MRANNVIKLYERLKELGIQLSQDDIKKIFDLSNDTAEKILELDDLSCWEYIRRIIYKKELKENLNEVVNILCDKQNKEKVKEITHVACDIDVINSGNLLKIMKIVANTKIDECAKWVVEAACDEDIVSSESVVEATTIVSNAKGSLQAERAFLILKRLNRNKAKKEETLKLAKMFASAKDFTVLPAAYIVANDIDVNDNGYAVELTKILLNSKGKNQSLNAEGVARSLKVIKSGKVIELTKIVSKAIDRVQSEYAALTIIREIDNENIEAIARRIANEKDVKKSLLLYNLISVGVELDECEKVLKALKKDINVTNIPAIGNLMSNKGYLGCAKPYRSICEILEDENEYIPFLSAFNMSEDDAINGLKEIEDKFPYVDYDEVSNCYVKVCKSKKESK